MADFASLVPDLLAEISTYLTNPDFFNFALCNKAVCRALAEQTGQRHIGHLAELEWLDMALDCSLDKWYADEHVPRFCGLFPNSILPADLSIRCCGYEITWTGELGRHSLHWTFFAVFDLTANDIRLRVCTELKRLMVQCGAKEKELRGIHKSAATGMQCSRTVKNTLAVLRRLWRCIRLLGSHNWAFAAPSVLKERYGELPDVFDNDNVAWQCFTENWQNLPENYDVRCLYKGKAKSGTTDGSKNCAPYNDGSYALRRIDLQRWLCFCRGQPKKMTFAWRKKYVEHVIGSMKQLMESLDAEQRDTATQSLLNT